MDFFCKFPKYILFLLLVILLPSFMLIGCMRTYQVYGGTANLSQLKRLHVTPGKRPPGFINHIRLTSLKNAAMTIGAQSGLAWRAKKIDKLLNKDSKQLDSLFNFNGMMLGDHVLPPVLTEARHTLNVASPDAIRLSDRYYRILKQARFVSMPPNWRAYLWMNYKRPARPNPALLPRNKYERKAWRGYVTKGWKAGIDQANTIYQQNLVRLKRDYVGMALYRNLYAQGMVSAPFVAHTSLGVTGGGSHLRIHDQVLRITALPQLTAKAKEWRPAVIHDNK